MIEETYLPQCLAMGIRVDDFWSLNIRKLHPFLKAEELKFKEKNREFHLMGIYVFDAVSIAISNLFRKNGSNYTSFPDKPYEFLSDEEMQRRKRQTELEKAKAQFMAFAEATKKRLEKDGKYGN